DLAEVQKWIRRGHNIGLRTGKISGIVVIDDDSVDASASSALNLPSTVTAITGSGKKHFYFKAPPDFPVGNSVKSLAPSIDIRGDGGQVVFVGSVPPDTKKPYTWAPSLSPDDVPIAELPENLLHRLRPRPKLKLVKNGRTAVESTTQAARV